MSGPKRSELEAPWETRIRLLHPSEQVLRSGDDRAWRALEQVHLVIGEGTSPDAALEAVLPRMPLLRTLILASLDNEQHLAAVRGSFPSVRTLGWFADRPLPPFDAFPSLAMVARVVRFADRVVPAMLADTRERGFALLVGYHPVGAIAHLVRAFDEHGPHEMRVLFSGNDLEIDPKGFYVRVRRDDRSAEVGWMGRGDRGSFGRIVELLRAADRSPVFATHGELVAEAEALRVPVIAAPIDVWRVE